MVITYVGIVAWIYIVMSLITAFFFDTYPKRLLSLGTLIARSMASFWLAPVMGLILMRYFIDEPRVIFWSSIGFYIYFTFLIARLNEQKTHPFKWIFWETMAFFLIVVINVIVLKSCATVCNFLPTPFVVIAFVILDSMIYSLIFKNKVKSSGYSYGKVRFRRSSASPSKIVLCAEERQEMIKKLNLDEKSLSAKMLSDEKLQKLCYKSERKRMKPSYESYEEFKLGMIGMVYFFIFFFGSFMVMSVLDKIKWPEGVGFSVSVMQAQLIWSGSVIFVLGLVFLLGWLVSPENYKSQTPFYKQTPVPPFPVYRRLLNVLITAICCFVMIFIIYIFASMCVRAQVLKEIGTNSPLIQSMQIVLSKVKPVLPAELPIRDVVSQNKF